MNRVRRDNSTPFESKVVLLPCGTARLAVLSSRAEPNSAVPHLMVSNGVLLPYLNRNDNFI